MEITYFLAQGKCRSCVITSSLNILWISNGRISIPSRFSRGPFFIFTERSQTSGRGPRGSQGSQVTPNCIHFIYIYMATLLPSIFVQGRRGGQEGRRADHQQLQLARQQRRRQLQPRQLQQEVTFTLRQSLAVP